MRHALFDAPSTVLVSADADPSLPFDHPDGSFVNTDGATVHVGSFLDLASRLAPYIPDRPYEAFAQLYNTVEFRTVLSPPVDYDIRNLEGPSGPVSKFLKATFILKGPAGTRVIAPHGIAGYNTSRFLLPAILVGTVVFSAAVGFKIGRLAPRLRGGVKTLGTKAAERAKTRGASRLARLRARVQAKGGGRLRKLRGLARVVDAASGIHSLVTGS